MVNSPSDTPLGDLLKQLEEQTERDYDLRELADILWLAMERDRRTPSPESVAPAQVEAAASEAEPEAVVTMVESDTEPLPPAASLVMPNKVADASGAASVVSEPVGSALPIFLSAPSPLANALALSRALYPLMRRVPSRTREYLDEDATVTQIADQRIKLPVMRPEPERWLELALVIEDTSILDIWQETLAAFQKLMERHGAFRDVRTWYVRTGSGLEGDGLVLSRKRSQAGAEGRTYKPKQIADATGRRLILVVSDCTSSLWRDGGASQGALPPVLADWARTGPVSLVQLLSAAHWERSALGQGYPVWLTARAPGTLNRGLGREGLRRRQVKMLAERQLVPFNLPVITLDEGPVRDWAKVLAGERDAETAGVVLGLPQEAPTMEAEFRDLLEQQQPERAEPHEPESHGLALTAQQEAQQKAQKIVARFWATASPPARRLAGMMARQPVSLPVARLIQRELLKDERPSLLAEIFLSGLIRARQSDGTDSQQTDQGSVWRYEFVEGVPQLLFRATPLNSTEEVQVSVMDGLQAALPETVREQIQEQARVEQARLNGAIGRELGLSQRQFQAYVVPRLLKRWWEEQEGGDAALGEVIISLAELSVPTLRAMGGEHAVLAEQLEEVEAGVTSGAVRVEPQQKEERLPIVFESLELETVQLVEAQQAEWPPLQTETITIATITLEASDDGLEQFTFKTATIAKQRQGILRGLFNRQKQTQWKITQQQASAYRFVQPLPGDIDLQMVAIPGGSFTMGSPRNEPERQRSEGPQHEVTLQPFYMARYPVTQAQWRAVAQLKQVDRELEPDPATFKGDDRPVERVSWEEATEFCLRLSQLTKHDYRLPTEAEWEYACRAGTTTAFHCGDMITTDLANYNGRAYAEGPKGKAREKTTVVGQFPANAWGLSEMHGNVWEWCQDHRHENYEGAPDDGSIWLEENPTKELRRQLRGGSWDDLPWFCRSALRDGSRPDNRNFNFGFRVVCVAPRT